MVIAVVDDLLFSSKIRSVAGKTGATVTFARTRESAVAAASDSSAALAIVDLEQRGGGATDTIKAMRLAGGPALRIVGYGSHVNVELLAAAREAGCDQAMARSAFVAVLPELLTASAEEVK